MNVCAELKVLFRAAVGPRRGYGHLLRCRALARALGVRPLLSIRGPEGSTDLALRFGCDIVNGPPHRLIRSLQLDVLIVDDPEPRLAARWIQAARAAGVAVASIHDLGLGCHDADLLIDGSVVSSFDARSRRTATGTKYAIVDPTLTQNAKAAGARRGVVISLGGGPRAEMACAIATEIARRARDVEVRIVGGFVARRPAGHGAGRRLSNVVWVGASTNLASELGSASVAVVGGGVSLYEACALGTPAVGVPVVASQRPTVAGFIKRGAALGRARSTVVPHKVADDALRLLRQERLRKFIARAARRLVDGRGAVRAAAAIARLAEGRR